jgi:FkbM family methyltransferase
VDVGAHSGELGLWAERFGLNYLGIEPDPVAFGALKRNLPGAFLEQVAVGAEGGSAEFSLATSTGDSSLAVGGRKTISVKLEKLDDVVSRSFPGGKIDLLKIEAEGFEPEVLSGATETLKRTSLLTVDAGAERLGESTAPACVNLLLDSGFKLRRVFLRRGIFLFSSDLFTGVL